VRPRVVRPEAPPAESRAPEIAAEAEAPGDSPPSPAPRGIDTNALLASALDHVDRREYDVALRHMQAARSLDPNARGVQEASRELEERIDREIGEDGVTLDSDQRVDASAVVVVTAVRAAAKLLPGLSIPEFNPAYGLYFDAPRAPAVRDYLVLDGEGEGPINELCVPSNVSREYAPVGRHLVSASVLGPLSLDDEALETAARKQLTGWFGPEVARWRLLRIDRIEEALPSQPPGEFEPGMQRARLTDGLFVCGDYRDLASLQGAMASGRRAALEVAGMLGSRAR